MQRMYFDALLEIFISKLYWPQMIGIHPRKRKILERDANQTKGVQQATMCEV
jgi:hypothetical protein